ncbi:outer membrane lipoprotein chaperone LolA [Legionella sp. CNM-4043-24]|uniref:outer membrane lipoprotein chaperone LolA n=1 Tax=Legionella sp. CNM-4043-24 TaxID=3421646 RepID=UPI00403AE1EE
MKKFLVLVLVLIVNTALAQSASEDVQARLNAIRSMTADFTQVVKAGRREVSNSSGSMALLRPGRFRWQTNSPLEQLIVADSKKLWVYDVDLEQVTVKKQEKGLGGTPALFLSGYDDTVARDFDVVETSKGDRAGFELRAKSSKENYQRVVLSFKGDALDRIEFFDQLGQHTIVSLSKVKTNPTLAARLFQFKPPKGVDIVEQ